MKLATTPISDSPEVSPGIGVLEKAMSLLNIVSAAGAGAALSFTDLLRRSSLPKATLHRILSTLMREGLLRYDPYTKTYRLGFRLLELAHEVWSDFDLRIAALDEMVQLRNTTGATVHLAAVDEHGVVLIATEEAANDTKPTSKVGQRLPLHASAAAKVLLAYLDPTRQLAMLNALSVERLTKNTLIRLDDIRSDLDLARARGYAIEVEETEEGRLAIAAPIFDIEGRPVGAVSASLLTERYSVAQVHGLSATLIGAARRITHNAGGQLMSIEPRAIPDQGLDIEVVCVSESRSLLGEGPMWSPRDSALYWVDILTPAVHRLDITNGKDNEIKLGSMVSVVVPKATGGLLLASPSGLVTFDAESKLLTPMCHPEFDRPGNRYNDGKCDRLGRLWIGSLDMATAANRGNLFRVDADATWKKMDSGFTVANGLGWSPNNKHMYFTDSAKRTIYVYDFDLPSGTIANRRPFLTLDPSDGTPDGMTVDEDGCLWVAIWDAWRVCRFSPEGKEMLRIKMPVPRPTSCCFGGDNLDTLYVTSASVRLNAEALAAAPLSGSLFAIRVPGVRGLPETLFAG